MNEFHNFRDEGFRDLFAMYRKTHGAGYALMIAYGIAFDDLPF